MNAQIFTIPPENPVSSRLICEHALILHIPSDIDITAVSVPEKLENSPMRMAESQGNH